MKALNGLWAVAAKELLHLKRDKATLVIALAIPIIQLTLFGFAIDFDVRHIATVIVDMDKSQESRQYIDGLRTTDYIQITQYLDTPEQAEAALRTGNTHVAVIIPPSYGRHSAPRDSAVSRSDGEGQVRVLIDGSDSQVAIRARMAFSRPPKGARLSPEARIDMVYNPDMKTTTFMIPGLIGVILQLVTVALTSFSLVREREQGTLEQLMVSPIGRVGLMIGKLIPYAVIGLIEVVSVLILGRIVFDVHVIGSVTLLIVLSIPFIVAALSLGLLISTIAQNQGQALQMTMLITMPSILMSGFMFPRETMPGFLYLISMAIPVTYYLQILRGVVVRGAGFFDLWPSVLALVVISVILLVISTMRFRKNVA